MRTVHFGNVANISYLLAYGLERYLRCKTYLMMSPKLPLYHEPYYGYDSGNPYKIDILYTLGSSPKQVKSISTLILKENIDIVHFHSSALLTTDLFAGIRGCKVVRHFHGSDLRLLSRKLRLLYRLLGQHKVLISTPDLVRHVWTRAIPRTEWLPNPVDPAIYETCDTEEDENTVFLPTRHDEHIKRTSVAFEAWRFLKKLNAKVRLKTIMYGRDAKKFQKLFRSDNRIIWLPLLTRQKYIQQLRSSPVIWGQFALGMLGQTELEAMAAGKPVITYWKRQPLECCSPPVPSYGSPQTIARITDLYLRDETSRRKLGAILQKWSLDQHHLEKVSRRLYDIYKEL